MDSRLALSMLAATVGPPVEDPWLAPHQGSAVARLLQILHRYTGALLADEVGLGKSRVAIVVAERFRRAGLGVDVIVPASLVPQWKRLLEVRGLDATLLSHDSLHHEPPGAEGRQRLLLVDEAHRFRNPSTRRYAALAERALGARLLLITATPFCNSRSDLFAILEIALADDALKEAGVLSLARTYATGDAMQIRRIFAEVIVRREASDAAGLKFPPLQEATIAITRGSSFDAIVDSIRRLAFPLLPARHEKQLMERFLVHRLNSSEAALADTLKRQNRFYRKAREMLARGQKLTRHDYRKLFGESAEERFYQDVLFPELWVRSAPSIVDSDELEVEIKAIETLIGSIPRSTSDKREKLLGLFAAAPGSQWLVFTAAIATARELRVLVDAAGRRCGMVTSSLSIDACNRRCGGSALFEQFRRREIEVLVCTDVAAEGLDLQEADHVVHYDLPWTPSRLDQRNGRSCRLGRIEATLVHRFVLSTADPIAAILRSKAVERGKIFGIAADAFSLGRWIDRAMSGRWDGSDHRGGSMLVVRRGMALRLLVIRCGRVTDDPSDVAAFFEVAQEKGSQTPDEALEEWQTTLQTRCRLPSFIPEDSPQRTLSMLLEKGGRDGTLVSLLQVRYRAGAEARIRAAIVDAGSSRREVCAAETALQATSVPAPWATSAAGRAG
jgi:superfamily II DNA or RNA helicase